MYLVPLGCLLAIVHAVPSRPSIFQEGFTLKPWAQEEALGQSQSSLKPGIKSHRPCTESSECGHTVCPAYDGKESTINDRDYRLYCINAPFGSYAGLPAAKSLEDCEAKCHASAYDCKALTFYPSTGTCYVIYSQDAKPYIWDNGYQKIGAIRADLDMAHGPGMICPLPGSDNQVWDYGPDKDPFKMSCTNQLNVPASAKKNVGSVKDVDECGQKCIDAKGYGFHYFQPYFPGGPVTGQRSCEVITEPVTEEHFAPLYKPNQYLTGLAVARFDCGEVGWNSDEKGDD